MIDATRGLPVIYLDFVGYDEQSHRRGPSSRFAHWSLKGIDGAIGRLRDLGGDPSNAVRRETLAAVQKALFQEIVHLEKGAAGPDVAILAQAFKSVKAIIDRQIELLEQKPPKRKAPSRGRARKVTVE